MALQWFVLLQAEEANDEDRRRCRLWRQADPAHEQAWGELERIWGGLEALAPRPQAMPLPLPLPANSTAAPAPKRPPARRRPAPWRAALLAASVLLVGAISWSLLPTGFLADHRTAVGELRRIVLEDGSQIELAARSALNVDFSPELREVELLAGEAFFNVSADPARPFVVRTEAGEVRVRGTAFNVRIEHGITVTVTQHSVEVGAGSEAGVTLTEGEQVHLDADGLTPVVQADLETVQAWREGRLVFINTPLSEVVAELGRYQSGHIRILGSDLGALRVTAAFEASRPGEVLDSIAASLDLRVRRLTDLLVTISAR